MNDTLRGCALLLLTAAVPGCATLKGGCPFGTEPRGAPWPAARETYCVKLVEGLGELRHGPNVQWYEDGTLFATGRFADNVEDGEWTYHDPKGSRISIIHYRKGDFHGLWTEFHRDGSERLKSETEWADGKKNGRHESWFASGRPREQGAFVDDRPVGHWVQWNQSGHKTREGDYVDGEPDGVWRMWYPDGKPASEIGFRRGVQHGLYREWHSEGGLSAEGSFVDGQPEGLARMWHQNGQVSWEGTYRDGKLEGRLTEWNASGEVTNVTEYRAGELVSN
jgi:antitoxin component YwqK of YwqJK toxin-antitoxin module